jgi:hypothetical protein
MTPVYAQLSTNLELWELYNGSLMLPLSNFHIMASPLLDTDLIISKEDHILLYIYYFLRPANISLLYQNVLAVTHYLNISIASYSVYDMVEHLRSLQNENNCPLQPWDDLYVPETCYGTGYYWIRRDLRNLREQEAQIIRAIKALGLIEDEELSNVIVKV